MAERLDKIGEILARGVYLHMKKEKETAKAKEEKEGFGSRLNELTPAGDDKNK